MTQEYSRACLIAFESLPKDANREGWGKSGTLHLFFFPSLSTPLGRSAHGVCAFRSTGTRWDGVCFRRFLLDTVPDLGLFLRTLT